MKVLLVGQPNVGKSSLINALTGAKVVISNYPGTTIDIVEGKTKIEGEEYIFMDTPGIYNLFPSSIEERVTEDIILEADYDFIIQVADAVSIERSLVITLSLIELGIPMILAINFWEEAEKRGIIIDEKKLEETLGIKVVKINPIKKEGLDNLIKSLGEVRKSNFKVIYDDDIEIAIQKTMNKLENTKLSRRGIAVKILEGDEVAIKKYGIKVDEIVKSIKKHPKLSIDIQVTKSGYASIIAKSITTLRAKEEMMCGFDRFILSNSVAGFLFSLSVFIVIFASLIYIGGWIQDILMYAFNNLIAFSPHNNSLVYVIMNQAILGLAAGLSIAVPYIGIFYIILSLMEDSGILSRFIVVLNRMLKKVGLPGKAIIPMMLGFGCSVAAIKASRILPSHSDRLKVAFLYSFIPCSSRTAVILGMVAHYAGATYAILIYLISFMLLFLTAKIINLVVKKEPMPIVEELPPYRMPRIKNVIAKSWIRMKSFVYVVIPLLIAGSMLYGFSLYYNAVNAIVKPLHPITAWLMLPDKSIIALFYGFLQKDLTIAMLANALDTLNFNSVMSKTQIFTFGMASTFQIPCVIAFFMIGKELGWKNAVVMEASSLVYGIFITGIIARLATLLI